MEDERVRITFHDQVVEAQITERSWRLVDSTGEEVAWSVLIVAPTLLPEERPAIVECRRDVDDLLDRDRVPRDLHAALTATLPEEPGGPVLGVEHAVVKRGMDERATDELTERYLALAESEPELKDDLLAWFKRAEEKRLFDSLALYDLRRQDGDPLPVATQNWNLEGTQERGLEGERLCPVRGEHAVRERDPGGRARAEPGPTARHPHPVRHARQPLHADRDEGAPASGGGGASPTRDPVRRAGGNDGSLRRPGRRPSGSPPDGPSCRCSPRPRRWPGSRRAPPRRRWRLGQGPNGVSALLRRRRRRGERPHAVERQRPVPRRRPGLESADRRGRLHARAAGPAGPHLAQRGLPVAGRRVHLDRPRRRSGRAHDRRDRRTRRHLRASPRSRRWAEAEATISTADRDRRRSPEATASTRSPAEPGATCCRATTEATTWREARARTPSWRAEPAMTSCSATRATTSCAAGTATIAWSAATGTTASTTRSRRPSRTRHQEATPWTVARATTGCTRAAAAEARRTR